jgi:hypothetical protein
MKWLSNFALETHLAFYAGDARRAEPSCTDIDVGTGGVDIHPKAAEIYAASNAGTGNAVTDLIFSMANRDVTFLSATAPISFL